MSDLSANLCIALDAVRSELEKEHILDKLKKIIEHQIPEIKKKTTAKLVLDETSSRIKSISSFKEKLARKNYLKKWNLNDHSSQVDCKKAIREKLSDLIGIRVNCFFKDDEIAIYNYFSDKLKRISDSFKKHPKTGMSQFLLSDDYKKDVKRLKTGDMLYKVSCEYKYKNSRYQTESCFFELQIKCLAHNLWGEVEHEISYKAPQYDYAFQSKNNQLRAIYSSLKSSDSQLKTLYTSQKYCEQDLINSLFFLYTHEIVEKDLNGKNSTQLYTWFFQFFREHGSLVKNYVKNHWTPEIPFHKETPKIDCENSILRYLINEVILSYFKGTFNDLYAIVKILYNIEEKNINWFIGQAIINQFVPKIDKTLRESPVLKEIMDDDKEDYKDFLDESTFLQNDDKDENDDCVDNSSKIAPIYKPEIYLEEIQGVINSDIQNQKETLLPTESKKILLQCVENLCYVISGGAQA